MPNSTGKARVKLMPSITREARVRLTPKGTREARVKLIDIARMETAAVTMGQSAEALVGYLSRLDALRDAGLGPEALAERAAEAELHTRVVLSTGMDALNELHDLGLFNDVPSKKDIDAFNATTLTEAMGQLAEMFRERMPTQRWDWMETVGRLVAGVEMRVETDERILRGTISHSGQSTVVRFDPAAMPEKRVSTRAFFSAGPERVYVPTSAIFSSRNNAAALVAPYDAVVGGFALVREWVYRHARNAAELGPPARTGGGPVLGVIAIVIFILAAAAAVAAAILSISCEQGSVKACALAAYWGLTAKILSTGSDAVAKQQQTLTYGTNPQ
jgi:hypothetical protein